MGIRTRISNWLRPETSSSQEVRSGEPLPGVIPPARTPAFTTDSAMTLPAVYRAVSLISTGVAQLSVDVWRGQKQIATPGWIDRPDMKISRFAFLEQTVTSLVTHGNAYWRVIRPAADALPDALVVANPWEVVIDEAGDGFHWRGQKLSSSQMVHMALMRRPDRREGLGPIQAARIELAGAVDLRDYSSNWFDAGTVPNGVLKSDQTLTGEQAKGYKEQFLESVGRHEPVVLGQGLSYSPIFLSPKDAQFLESRQYGSQEVARLFGIPSHLMIVSQEGTSQTYLNQQDADLEFSKWTLMRYIREIEEAFTGLLPRTQVARFNVDAVLRASTKARYEAHKIGLEAGFLTINEVRDIEGLDPLEGQA